MGPKTRAAVIAMAPPVLNGDVTVTFTDNTGAFDHHQGLAGGLHGF